MSEHNTYQDQEGFLENQNSSIKNNQGLEKNQNSSSENQKTDRNRIRNPKNVRQIGKVEDNKKIYMEDYVHTYTKQITERELTERSFAVLIGEFNAHDLGRNIIIYGAIEVKNEFDETGKTVMSEDAWTYIYETVKKYFPEGEIVGWYFGGAGFGAQEEDLLKQIHLDNFYGMDKILLTYDYLEREMDFYIYEGGRMLLLPGYYIYYEKNVEMQNYMIDQKQPQAKSLVIPDKTVTQIREKLEEKRKPVEPAREQGSLLRLAYVAGSLMILVTLAVGITVMNSNEKIKSLEQALSAISNSITKTTTKSTDTIEELQSTENNMQENIFDVSHEMTAEHEIAFDEVETSLSDGKENSNSKNVSEHQENIEGTNSSLKNSTDTPKQSDKSENEGQADTTELSGEQNSNEEGKATEEVTEEVEKGTEEKSKNTLNTEVTTINPASLNKYVVKEGDTLAGISIRLYGSYSKLQTIKELNQLINEDKIFVGQELIVP